MPQAAARFPRRDPTHAGTRIGTGAGRRPRRAPSGWTFDWTRLQAKGRGRIQSQYRMDPHRCLWGLGSLLLAAGAWLGVMAQGHTGPLNAFRWWVETSSMNELSS